jgi:hypothetical protein
VVYSGIKKKIKINYLKSYVLIAILYSIKKIYNNIIGLILLKKLIPLPHRITTNLFGVLMIILNYLIFLAKIPKVGKNYKILLIKKKLLMMLCYNLCSSLLLILIPICKNLSDLPFLKIFNTMYLINLFQSN